MQQPLPGVAGELRVRVRRDCFCKGIKLVQKLFQIRVCTIPIDGSLPRPCLYYHMKACLGPCVDDLTDARSYAEAVDELKLFLAGRHSELLPRLEELSHLVNEAGSDSSSLDNLLEVFLAGGMDIYRAMRLLMPPAVRDDMDPDLKAFLEFNSMHQEPWDGPAGVVSMLKERRWCFTTTISRSRGWPPSPPDWCGRRRAARLR